MYIYVTVFTFINTNLHIVVELWRIMLAVFNRHILVKALLLQMLKYSIVGNIRAGIKFGG